MRQRGGEEHSKQRKWHVQHPCSWRKCGLFRGWMMARAPGARGGESVIGMRLGVGAADRQGQTLEVL